jgi:hypothetical protein
VHDLERTDNFVEVLDELIGFTKDEKEMLIAILGLFHISEMFTGNTKDG